VYSTYQYGSSLYQLRIRTVKAFVEICIEISLFSNKKEQFGAISHGASDTFLGQQGTN
jgi:hypothetical protein